MKVSFDATARDDLERIRRWIAQDNPARALTFISELRSCARALSDKPLRHPVFAHTGAGNVHKLTHGNYLLLYRVLPDAVEVIAVRHARRDTPRFD